MKLYSRWVRPYLKAASELEQKEQGRNANLVKTFNTIILELTLLGKSKIDVKKSAISGDLPAEFSNERFLRGIKRNYNTCVLVDFVFRGIPQRVSQQSHYVFGGRVDVTFRAYALNDDELKKLDEQMGKSDMEDALKLIEGATGESLEQLQKEINYFLEEDEPKKEEKKKSADNSNPFLALIGHYDKKEKTEEKKEDPKKKKEPVPDVIKDNWIEETHLRKLTVEKVKSLTYDLFNIYKKAHGMPSYD